MLQKKSLKNGAKLGENGKIDLLNLCETQFSVRFPKPKNQNQLTDPSLKTKSILSGPIFLIRMFSSKVCYVSFDQN